MKAIVSDSRAWKIQFNLFSKSCAEQRAYGPLDRVLRDDQT